ncbi:MAG: GH3 auxin-responsive promoter family protein [Prolixibacteraceae bacterium]|nr:GH3 auxin-responsive promoter family protein [Prolixibacteraceae bacterium]
MAIINSVLNWLVRKRMHQIEYFKAFPHEVQNDLFLHLITYAEDTEWGLKYDYRTIKNFETFRERVPVSTYEDLMPIVERLKQGEQNLLWPGEVKWFAKSSGTSGSKSKFIPISRFTLEECHYKAGKDVLTLYLNNFPESEVFYGKGLLMGGSQNIQEVSNSSYYEGDLSAILIHNMPYWSQILRTPSQSIALMDEWESKLTLMAESTMNHHVTSISGVPSWTLVLLNRILELSGKKYITEVWPDLEVFFHGGVSFAPYREQYLSLIPDKDMHYFETYNASEGFFAIQDRPNASDMLLMLDYGIFYEFVKADEIGKRFPKSFTLEEVELGVNYAMVISTNSGLWRYVIGDTVQFTSLKPYRIQVTGRTKNFINIVGEELMVDNAEKALAAAASKTHATVRDYTAAPLYEGDTIRHEWLIEFSTPPTNFESFVKIFDESLQSLNSDYEAKRYHDLVLKPPLIRSLEEGSFYDWLKRNNKLGGQHKVPRLMNNRGIVDDILKNSNLSINNLNLKIQ